jgi:hypothetical protein
VVELADPEVDFRDYDLLYVVPSRNATNIAFSPEFNKLRRALGNDAATICDPGVLVYRLDASIPNGDGSIQVHDAKPNSGRQGPCTELDIGTLGTGAGEPTVFHDAATGVTIEVVREGEADAVVRVTKD